MYVGFYITFIGLLTSMYIEQTPSVVLLMIFDILLLVIPAKLKMFLNCSYENQLLISADGSKGRKCNHER
jgi:hypothetical protein